MSFCRVGAVYNFPAIVCIAKNFTSCIARKFTIEDNFTCEANFTALSVARSKLVFRADFNADTANASSADVLEFFLHVFRAFFRIVVSFPVRFGQFSEDCPSRASTHTSGAFSAPVFNHFSRRSKGHVRNHGGKSYLAAVFFGQEKSAFSDKTKP